VLIGVPNLLVVPGGGWVDGEPKGVRAQIARGTLLDVIQRVHQRGSVVAGVCTGAMALATAGILDRRPATTHHLTLQDLRKTGACVVTSRVVDAGDVVTCAGVTASLDLSLWLVERFWGLQAAEAVSRQLEYQRSPDVYVEMERAKWGVVIGAREHPEPRNEQHAI